MNAWRPMVRAPVPGTGATSSDSTPLMNVSVRCERLAGHVLASRNTSSTRGPMRSHPNVAAYRRLASRSTASRRSACSMAVAIAPTSGATSASPSKSAHQVDQSTDGGGNHWRAGSVRLERDVPEALQLTRRDHAQVAGGVQGRQVLIGDAPRNRTSSRTPSVDASASSSSRSGPVPAIASTGRWSVGKRAIAEISKSRPIRRTRRRTVTTTGPATGRPRRRRAAARSMTSPYGARSMPAGSTRIRSRATPYSRISKSRYAVDRTMHRDAAR